MLPFRRILAPVDYSEPCKAVIPYVQDTVRHFSAELTLVHSYGPQALALSQLRGDPDLPEEVRAIEEQRLAEFAREMFPGQHTETIAQLGEPGTVIKSVIERQGTDLVMMATQGNGPLRRLLLGSVTAKVLHDVAAPVWTGTGSALANHAAKIPYQSILCALDDTEQAEGVLRAAAAITETYRAHLSLVHVVETPPASFELDFGGLRKDLLDAADLRLRELKGAAGVDAPHAVVDGGISGAIGAEAVRRNADLIVAGRGHAQGGLSRVWSNVYSIVRESPCPVLSV